MTDHDHDYYHDDCLLCQDEKQAALTAKEDILEFKRRAAVLSILEDDLINILNEADFDIPESGVITAVWHNAIRGTFDVKVCDKSFPVVGLNCSMPSLGMVTNE
jgi:hypothetical protein